MQSLYDVLVAARAKIDCPEKWGQGHRSIRPGYRGLNTFCAAEAIEDVSRTDKEEDFFRLRKQAFRLLEDCAGIRTELDWYKFQGIAAWNDENTTTYEDVIRAFDHAIAITKDFK